MCSLSKIHPCMSSLCISLQWSTIPSVVCHHGGKKEKHVFTCCLSLLLVRNVGLDPNVVFHQCQALPTNQLFADFSPPSEYAPRGPLFMKSSISGYSVGTVGRKDRKCLLMKLLWWHLNPGHCLLEVNKLGQRSQIFLRKS